MAYGDILIEYDVKCDVPDCWNTGPRKPSLEASREAAKSVGFALSPDGDYCSTHAGRMA